MAYHQISVFYEFESEMISFDIKSGLDYVWPVSSHKNGPNDDDLGQEMEMRGRL